LSSLCAIRGGYRNDFSSGSHSNALPNFSLPSTIIEERHTDVTVALMSVFAACRVTRHVQPTSSNNIETISKQDASPVTVGDFASQALALQILHHHFPHDMFIAEEGSEALQKDDSMLNKVWEAVNHVQEGILDKKEEILNAIDYGQGMGVVENNQQSTGSSRRRRVWCLDPIDGTKGFLRGRVEGGQFCIALALLEDGEPVISVLGCPNLPLPSTQAASVVPFGLWSEHEVQESLKQNTMFIPTRGSMFVAIRGNGCYEIPLHQIEKYLLGESTESTPVTWTQLRVTPNDGSSKPLSQAKFCLGEFAAVKDE
jgi:3'-phosphoadenosine 5'-phosphosulfate (PAPS) 3'-phosphatase